MTSEECGKRFRWRSKRRRGVKKACRRPVGHLGQHMPFPTTGDLERARRRGRLK